MISLRHKAIYHSTGLYLCCNKYGDFSFARRFSFTAFLEVSILCTTRDEQKERGLGQLGDGNREMRFMLASITGNVQLTLGFEGGWRKLRKVDDGKRKVFLANAIMQSHKRKCLCVE